MSSHPIDSLPVPPAWLALNPGRLRAAVALVILGCVLLACSNTFIQDDAFISFRYAANLVHGQGLTWNPGERVEGYTNFLWTVIMAIPIALGADPVRASWALGISIFAFTLVLAYRLGTLVLRSRVRGLVAAGLLGTNYTFSSYATGGLETQLQVCLLTGAAYAAVRVLRTGAPRPLPLVMISLTSAAALLTRLDSSLYVAVLYSALFVHFGSVRGELRARIAATAWLCVPSAIVVVAWLAWKLAYYGDVLPNTFYTRIGGLQAIRHGIFYLHAFVTSYWLAPFAFLLPLALARPGVARREVSLALLIVSIWCLYIIWAGGDFMEFRFIVPVMPLVFVVITWLVTEHVPKREFAAALVAMIVAGSFAHAIFFRETGEIESIANLRRHVSAGGEDWEGVGRQLARFFGGPDRVTIATSAVGAISYYSGLEVVDMLGLNDRWVARYGVISGVRPGHQRQATTSYLLSRGVNLVIGQPWLVPADAAYPRASRMEEVHRFRVPDAMPDQVPRQANVLEIPINSRSKLFVLYLLPNGAVDRAIVANRLTSHSIAPN